MYNCAPFISIFMASVVESIKSGKNLNLESRNLRTK